MIFFVPKFFLLLPVFLLVGFATTTGAASAAENPQLILYTYDSFMAKGALGPKIIPLFEKACSCNVKALPVGNGGQLIARLQIDAERGKPTAHLVLGLDQETLPRALPYLEPLKDWRPKNYGQIRKELRIGEGYFIPTDYGIFAFMVDHEALKKSGLSVPRSLKDLLHPGWKRNIILQDPRTSTPGMAFLAYAHKASNGASFWRGFKGNWLTLSQSWTEAYGLFLKGEAPLVWSYTSSQAYHHEKGQGGRYEALMFEEGQPLQIEGAALVKGVGENPATAKLARDFLEFLLSTEVQGAVPQTQWMLPAVKGIKLPASFSKLPRARKIVPIQNQKAHELLRDWARAIR